jgi:hypothetical protein
MATCLIMQLRLKKKEVCYDSEVPRFVLKVLQTTISAYIMASSTYAGKHNETVALFNYFPTIAHNGTER